MKEIEYLRRDIRCLIQPVTDAPKDVEPWEFNGVVNSAVVDKAKRCAQGAGGSLLAGVSNFSPERHGVRTYKDWLLYWIEASGGHLATLQPSGDTDLFLGIL
ncbi:hypothetical protein TK50_00615 [Micromonospora haikouensis]|uniref:Uncharacterized protein n=1 Tax=Micromonospora haikouensis TaxID=686309 RepID=A0A0D0X061_9ACTN|nr:hypothetical protein TK50_00615 [Micromonospora haikouensis]